MEVTRHPAHAERFELRPQQSLKTKSAVREYTIVATTWLQLHTRIEEQLIFEETDIGIVKLLAW